ncbi:B-cell lymphoma 6 protein-like isoform X1 [Branchiostoma floridae]|uniref:B-cell lymphoma 6 protein-like isoform X1 n=4 Tax=Branchiostoma floridae TaxID=7739 RepID=A0A9J7L5C2_BRAFL|nr:B-cell lymphoma 6 protein-like isoform X1 [Branchiostoma floridae]
MEYVYLKSKMSSTSESFIHYYPNQYKALVRGLDSQRRQGLMCDVVIKVRGTEFKAHSAVLAACSDYFCSAVPSFQPGTHKTVNLPNVTPEGFEQVLDFVYTASLRLSAANVLDVLSAASYVHMHEVVRICTDFIKTRFEMKPKESSQDSGEASSRTVNSNIPLESIVNALSSTAGTAGSRTTPACASSTSNSENRPLVHSSPHSIVNTSPQSSTPTVEHTPSHPTTALNRGTPSERGNPEFVQDRQESPSTSQATHFQVKIEPPDTYEGLSASFVQQTTNSQPHSSQQTSPDLSSSVESTSAMVGASRLGMAVPAMETGPVGDLAAVSSIVHNVFASQGTPNRLILGGGMEMDTTSTLRAEETTHMGSTERPSPSSRCNDVGGSNDPESDAVMTWKVVNPENPMHMWYECGICRKPFRDLERLHKHEKLHAPGGPKNHQRPYKCPMCHAFFTTRSTLETHWRRHSGERPFKCKTCSASFTQRSNLKRHIRVHTGEKPYQCQVCGVRFTQSNSLKAHYGFKHFQDGPGVDESQLTLPSPDPGAT